MRLMLAQSIFLITNTRAWLRKETHEQRKVGVAGNSATSFHLMGSCRMGPEGDATAVVDHKLRVRGMDGLRVADASIMPTMPAANTNAASLMIGEKAADLIRGD